MYLESLAWGVDTPKAGGARQVHVVRREQADRGGYQKSTSERRRASEWSRQKGRR